jgi:hypothetical protein
MNNPKMVVLIRMLSCCMQIAVRIFYSLKRMLKLAAMLIIQLFVLLPRIILKVKASLLAWVANLP